MGIDHQIAVPGLCGQACEVCEVHHQLLDDGATPYLLSVFREQACSLGVTLEEPYECLTRVSLDRLKASYGETDEPGRLSRMCDFAMAVLRNESVSVLVIELKSGSATRTAVDQLQAGLEVIHDQLSPDVPAHPHACLVTKYLPDRFRRILISKPILLSFGSLHSRPKVRSCGDSILL